VSSVEFAQLVEWVRPNQVPKLFGFGRSFIYDRLKDRSWDSVSIKKPGSRRSVRLINAQSIRAYIAEHRDTQSTDKKPPSLREDPF
jgi:predicted DNA-binding transcriptional regulator AlpA